MADMDQIWERGKTRSEALEQPEGILQLNDQPGNTSGEDLEQPEGILQLIDKPGNTSGEDLEQPEGILQLIDKLETIVDQMLRGWLL